MNHFEIKPKSMADGQLHGIFDESEIGMYQLVVRSYHYINRVTMPHLGDYDDRSLQACKAHARTYV
jgi:hypothetical protein